MWISSGLVLTGLLGGCLSYRPVERPADTATSPGSTEPRFDTTVLIEETELEQLTKAYADRYMTLIASACDQLGAGAATPEQRRAAHQFKLGSITSIYDIATNADPFTQLVDMVLVVTLQSQVWIDEGRADDVFGDRAMELIRPLRRAREDVWDLAARALTAEQLEQLDYLIWDWRRENPEVELVSYVRFDDFAASRGRSIIADVRAGFGLLAPVDEAKKAVDEARLYGERVFFLAKRLPFLLSWQVEALLYEAMAEPRIDATFEGYQEMADASRRAVEALEAIPSHVAREREAIFTELDDRETELHATFDRYNESLAGTQRLVDSLEQVAQASEALVVEGRHASESLRETVLAVDQLLAREDSRPTEGNEAEPFRVQEYADAATELGEAARELNMLVASASGLIESDAWSRRLADLDATAAAGVQEATTGGMALVDHAFKRCVALILIFFIALVVYRIISLWVSRRLSRGDRST